MSRVKGLLEKYENWQRRVGDGEVLIQMGLDEGDESVGAEVELDLKALGKELQEFELTRLLSGEYDDSSAIVGFV